MSVTILETDAGGGNACRRNCVELDTLCAEVCPTHEPLTGLAVRFAAIAVACFGCAPSLLAQASGPIAPQPGTPIQQATATRRKNRRQRRARQYADHCARQQGQHDSHAGREGFSDHRQRRGAKAFCTSTWAAIRFRLSCWLKRVRASRRFCRRSARREFSSRRP